MFIKAAINGGRTKAEHDAVPVSPAEQAATVVECLQAGVDVIHLHVRSESGIESLDPLDVADTLKAVKAAAPGAKIGVSTGAWIVPDTKERLNLVQAWHVLPEFASVNFSEAGAADLSQLLLSKGVGVEAGLCDANDARVLIESGVTSQCLRILLEPQEQDIEAARRAVRGMERVLDENSVSVSRLLHGTGTTAWSLFRDAHTRGYGARIGFEDTLHLNSGQRAESNAELIREASRLIK